MVNYWLAKQAPKSHNFATLKKEMKKHKKFKSWELLRISRLSFMPVPKEIWNSIMKMSGK